MIFWRGTIIKVSFIADMTLKSNTKNYILVDVKKICPTSKQSASRILAPAVMILNDHTSAKIRLVVTFINTIVNVRYTVYTLKYIIELILRFFA
jgi:hypothetical protein